jgi:hypothetical protein
VSDALLGVKVFSPQVFFDAADRGAGRTVPVSYRYSDRPK